MELRKGYKQTEVGVIPEEWEVKRLADVASVKTGPFGTLLKASEYSKSDGVPLISVGEIREGRLKVTDNTPKVCQAVIKRLPQYLLNPGDIVLGRKGAVERSALVLDSQKGWFLGSDSIGLRPVKTCFPDYLSYQFLSGRMKGWLLNNAIGTTMASLNQEILKEAHIPFPPTRAEQTAIAKALSDVDAWIQSLTRLIAKKRQIKQGTMQVLLNPYEKGRLKEGWAEKRLSDISVIKARIGWQGLTTAEYKKDGEYYLITGTEFKFGFINWDNCFYVDVLRFRQDKNIQVRKGDILVTKDGTIGKVAFIKKLKKPATLNNGIFIIRPRDDAFYPEFFYYVLLSEVFRSFLAQLSAGSTINHLYQKDFVNFQFYLPKKRTEQTRIATILSDMDSEIAALEKKLAKAKQIKQGMMQQLLTGQIRLVQPTAKVTPIASKHRLAQNHNEHFHEAVVISVLAERFGSVQYPLGRKRYTKLSYLLHRYSQESTAAYRKKAAGPYNPKTRYSGAEKIALRSRYIREHNNGKYRGFVADEHVDKAHTYFEQWYGQEALSWLEQFRKIPNDTLELWTTVDMAMVELDAAETKVDLAAVKGIIAGNEEWKPKLDRAVFSDVGIVDAMRKSRALFSF